MSNLSERQRASLDPAIDVWRLPGLMLGSTPARSSGEGIGGAESIRVSFDLGRRRGTIRAVVELAYKSTGFLQGYKLDAAPIVMAGVSIGR